jgi:Fe-S-cluster formation regulator IscX/YfhJ
VVIATYDVRFASYAAFVLARQGFDVETSRGPEKLLDTVVLKHPHVAVIDGSGALPKATRLGHAVRSLEPHTAVLVVTDGTPPLDAARDFPVVAKWAELERLPEALRRAYERGDQREVAYGDGR